MNSTLYLFTNCKLLKDRNFKIERGTDFIYSVRDVSDSYQQIANFQYIKHSLKFSIKVDKNQANLEYLSAHNINYAIIINMTTDTGRKPVGYFVINKKWLSENTIQLDLEMDTINSLLDDCELSDRTKIIRQHKDRLRVIDTYSVVGNVLTIPNSDFTLDSGVQDKLYISKTIAVGEKLASNSAFLFDVSQEFPSSSQYGIQPLQFYAMVDYPSLSAEVIYFDMTILFLDANYKVVQFVHSSRETACMVNISSTDGVLITSEYIPFTDDTKYVAMVLTQVNSDSSINRTLKIGINNSVQQALERIALTISDTKFINKNGFYYQSDSRKFARIIDRYSENVFPQLYAEQNLYLNEWSNNFLNQSFYLVYMNQNDPTESLVNPVNCFLYGDKQSTIRAGANDGSFTKTYTAIDLAIELEPLFSPENIDIEDAFKNGGWWAIFTGKNNLNMQFKATPITSLGASTAINLTLSNESDFVALTWYYYGVRVVARVGNTFYVEQNTIYFGEDSLKITNATKCVQGSLNDTFDFSNYPVFPLIPTSATTSTIYPISSVDRTDPKIIKIIKLPYCPANIYVDENGYLVYDQKQWQYSATKHALQVRDSNSTQAVDCFDRLLTFDINPFEYQIISSTISPRKVQLKSDEFESKLGHSDYYIPKIIYDSFTFAFQLELMTEIIDRSDFRVQFNVSGTLTSKFMFSFIDYICENCEVRDYNNIMYIARNNECIIFNQQYVNYIRNGYQYDRKAIDINFSKQALNIGLSSQNMISDTVNGFNTGGVAGAIMGFGKSGLNLAGRLQNMFYDIGSELNSQFAKEQQLRNASTGVIDANDVDLLEVYSKNRLAYKVYSISPRDRKIIYDMFYYTGYICGQLGLPDTTSRTRFNFVSADVVFKKVPNLPAEIIEDIKSKYLAGITFMHKYSGAYDFDQKYENWETSIIDYLGD